MPFQDAEAAFGGVSGGFLASFEQDSGLDDRDAVQAGVELPVAATVDQWRSSFPLQTGIGAVPLCRAKAAELRRRVISPILPGVWRRSPRSRAPEAERVVLTIYGHGSPPLDIGGGDGNRTRAISLGTSY